MQDLGWWWWWAAAAEYYTRCPLVPIEHCLNSAADPRIVADHVHPLMTTLYTAFDDGFQQESKAMWQNTDNLKLFFLNIKMSSLHSKFKYYNNANTTENHREGINNTPYIKDILSIAILTSCKYKKIYLDWSGTLSGINVEEKIPCMGLPGQRVTVWISNKRVKQC